MKFTKWGSLEKHLQETSALDASYLIACAHETDRREIAAKIVSAAERQLNQIMPLPLMRFVGSSGFTSAFAELQTESLFSTHRMILVDEVDKLKEEESTYLRRWLQNPSKNILLFLGIENTRGLAAFLPFVKSQVVLLDLLQEKPWERQQRLLDDLRFIARTSEVRVEEEVWDFLMQQGGTDCSLLKNELEKLLAYGSQKKSVNLEEARSVIASSVFPEGWTLAEHLVFYPYSLSTLPFLDANALLSLMGQLRYYLRLGWQLSKGEEKALKPYQIQKYGDKSRDKGSRFFEGGLLVLNEMEALAKSSSLSSEILLHRFAVKLHTTKNYNRL